LEIDGASNTVVTGISDANTNAVAGAIVKRLEQGKYEITVPLSLASHQCYSFCIDGNHLNASGIITTKKVYQPEDPPTASFNELVGDTGAIVGDYTAWVDVYAVGGAPAGRVQFGVFIPAGMFGYFVQFNNLAASTVPLMNFTLDQSQAGDPPVIMGDLGLPHNGMRACCGTPEFPVVPVAAFESPGFAPGTPVTTMTYSPGDDAVVCDFSGAGGIPPGGSSNVLAYLSSSPPSIQSEGELSPVVTSLSGLGLLASGRSLGPRARHGDLDADGDEDLADFAKFCRCYTGPGAYASAGCDLGDLDGDGDVDLIDHNLFVAELNGPAGP